MCILFCTLSLQSMTTDSANAPSSSLLSATCDCVRLWDQSCQTAANWIAIREDGAPGPGSTWRRIAWTRFLHTLLIVANVTGSGNPAIRITDTRTATGECVRLRDQTGLTPEKSAPAKEIFVQSCHIFIPANC